MPYMHILAMANLLRIFGIFIYFRQAYFENSEINGRT